MQNLVKFRASCFSKLTTEPRSKSEVLSETTKTYLKELFIELKYGRKKEIDNKFLQKGNLVEENSMTLLSEYTGNFFKKNESFFENDYCTGTPDIIFNNEIYDTKSSWDIWTFSDAELSKAYEWQMLIYMWLTGLKKAHVCFCLVDTPAHLIVDAQRRYCWQNGITNFESQEFYDICDQFEKNMTYSDIPTTEKVKIFSVDYDETKIELAVKKIDLCRNYLNNLSL